MSEDSYLFDTKPFSIEKRSKTFLTTETPIWTRNKARFIARYLKTFTYVTKHGTYIDAFAGPQHEQTSETTWSAKLVLENQPAWLRNFYLFEKEATQIDHLRRIEAEYRSRHEDINKRSIFITQGDCNVTIPQFLKQNPIREKEASFCLFDQRSTECHWDTVRFVAQHKGVNEGNKIELFYFLAQGWIDRAIKSWRIDAEERCEKWWGQSGAHDFLTLGSHERGRFMANRFKNELGYSYAYPFPIQQEGKQGRIMFWMIHASDHPRAPDLMWQAYRHIGAGRGLNEPIDQLTFGILNG